MRTGASFACTEGLVQCAETIGLIAPQYSKAVNGRPPVGLDRMLPMANLPYDKAARLYSDSAYPETTQKQRGKDLWGLSKVSKVRKLGYCGLAKIANRAYAMLAMLSIIKWGRPITAQVYPA